MIDYIISVIHTLLYVWMLVGSAAVGAMILLYSVAMTAL